MQNVKQFSEETKSLLFIKKQFTIKQNDTHDLTKINKLQAQDVGQAGKEYCWVTHFEAPKHVKHRLTWTML